MQISHRGRDTVTPCLVSLGEPAGQIGCLTALKHVDHEPAINISDSTNPCRG